MNDKMPGSGGSQAPGADDTSNPRGKLKIFFSYAPGTGKTLSMLEDAFRHQQEGKDVVAGFVDPSGDLLTLQLLEKFEVLPQRVVTGSGIMYHGMDLDALLRRRPQLALVDNLARSNPPGLRHESRYLEVDELLNAGIDVYTTLNVYQLESQVDAVAYLTGVVVHDTIPDRYLDAANQIEMVDLPPQDLLERYRNGSIPVSPRIQLQMEKFFQPSNLFALRELTLRYVARRSNTFMRGLIQGTELSSAEAGASRLLVCIGNSPSSGSLIRAGRRMADETRSDWTVIYVESPDQFDDSEVQQTAVAQYLRLAEMLGAQVETVTGRSVLSAIREYVQKHNIRRIMIGRSERRPWQRIFGVSLAEQLMRDNPMTSVYIVGSDHTPRPFSRVGLGDWLSKMQFLGSLALVILPTMLGIALTPGVISRSANLIMLYLLSVVIASVFFGLIPALLTAVLSVLAFDFFFVPPIYQLFYFAPENGITFLALLTISIIISTLVSRERVLSRAAQRRAEQVTRLYEFSRDLATAVDMEDIQKTILHHVHRTFDRDMVILLPRNGQLVLSAAEQGKSLDMSELTAAEWAFQQGRPAGNNTGTFSYAAYRYFPLETSRGIIGVMGVRMSDRMGGGLPELHPEQMRMLGTYVAKVAASIERALFAEEASQAEILRATDKLQTALLNSISHDLRTPLASITGVLSSLRVEEEMLDAETRRELVETALGEAERLNRLVGNLLDMTRLESGNMRINIQPCDVQDLIGSSLNALGSRLERHPLSVDISPDLPLVPLDYVLINQVIINLLDNAAKYSPEDGALDIRAEDAGEVVQIAVEDNGPGIPQEDLERIFEKFYRVKRFENVVGTGLGLSICKGIVEVHGGKIWAENRPEGGLRMVFTLPLKPSTLLETEPEDQEYPEEVKT